LFEIGKGESAGDVVLVYDLPGWKLFLQAGQFSALQRRDISAAWHTGSAGKFSHGMT
jgi:hypothetical protein